MDSISTGEDLALSFARALVAGDFPKAHACLSHGLRAAMSERRLRWRYKAMVFLPALLHRKASHVELTTSLTEWPAKANGDIGWFYVSITDNERWAEAVTVVVCYENGSAVIRRLEWGRP
jgi:hypothetical protein